MMICLLITFFLFNLQFQFQFNNAVVSPNSTNAPRKFVRDFVFPDALREMNMHLDKETTATVGARNDPQEKQVNPIATTTRTTIPTTTRTTTRTTIPTTTTTTTAAPTTKTLLPNTSLRGNSPERVCANFDKLQDVKSARLLIIQYGNVVDENAVDRVRSIIADELDLFDLDYSILQAKKIGNTILFEMSTPEEATEIFQQYCQLLKAEQWGTKSPKKFIIRQTERDFYDDVLSVRTAQ